MSHYMVYSELLCLAETWGWRWNLSLVTSYQSWKFAKRGTLLILLLSSRNAQCVLGWWNCQFLYIVPPVRAFCTVDFPNTAMGITYSTAQRSQVYVSRNFLCLSHMHTLTRAHAGHPHSPTHKYTHAYALTCTPTTYSHFHMHAGLHYDTEHSLFVAILISTSCQMATQRKRVLRPLLIVMFVQYWISHKQKHELIFSRTLWFEG